MELHLAQLNIALPREPLDSPLLAEFVAALEPVNAAADASPGFVWRLQTEDGDATAVRILGVRGPSPDAFTFRSAFPADELCPAG